MQTRREIIHEASKGYNKLSKKEKGIKLDGVVAVTGYNRDYALRLLSLQDIFIHVLNLTWLFSSKRCIESANGGILCKIKNR